jgi:hypothetical protein
MLFEWPSCNPPQSPYHWHSHLSGPDPALRPLASLNPTFPFLSISQSLELNDFILKKPYFIFSCHNSDAKRALFMETKSFQTQKQVPFHIFQGHRVFLFRNAMGTYLLPGKEVQKDSNISQKDQRKVVFIVKRV